ncbi:MAG: hypothetical protein IJS92_05985 [Paludibacteraceae bacterium]|nr:hypothetical protein [Paludibacteraceae bacterium]
MKKFLSLLCAVAIVLGASAAPVAKKAGAVKFQRAAVEKLRTEKKSLAKKSVKKDAFAQKKQAEMQKNARLAAGEAKIATASQKRAKAEAIEVTCGSWEIEDWGTDGELRLYGEDNTFAFYFDIIYGGDATDLQLGKTYTVEDIYVGNDGQYGAVFYDGAWHYGIKELTLVKTIDEKSLVHFVGSCVDSLDAAFTFHYDEEEFIPTGEEVNHSFKTSAKLSYSSYFQDWTISVADAEYGFKLDILSENSESAVGAYDSENGDFDLDYTEVEIFTSEDASTVVDAKSAKAVIVERNDSLIIAAEILASDGVKYIFDAFFAAPTKQGEATIEATNLVIDDSWYAYFGIVMATASNDDYDVYFSLPGTSGDFVIGEEASGDINNIEMYSGSIKIVNGSEGAELTGKVLCYDNIEYTLDLKYVRPDKTRDVAIEISDAVLTIYPDSKDWQVVGVNASETFYVALDIVSDAVEGTYSEADLDLQYTAIDSVYVKNDSLKVAEEYTPLALNIIVTFNAQDSTAVITGTYLGQGYLDGKDVPEFTLNISAKVKTYVPSTEIEYDAEENFNAQYPTYEIDDSYLANYGVLFITATNDDRETIVLEAWLPTGASELVAGEYPVSAEEGEPGTLTAGSVSGQSLSGSFAGTTDAEGYYNIPLWFIVDGVMTVNDKAVIEVQGINSKGYKVNARLGEYGASVANTDAKAVATKILRNGQLIIRRNNVEYDAQGVTLSK